MRQNSLIKFLSGYQKFVSNLQDIAMNDEICKRRFKDMYLVELEWTKACYVLF